MIFTDSHKSLGAPFIAYRAVITPPPNRRVVLWADEYPRLPGLSLPVDSGFINGAGPTTQGRRVAEAEDRWGTWKMLRALASALEQQGR